MSFEREEVVISKAGKSFQISFVKNTLNTLAMHSVLASRRRDAVFANIAK